MNCTVLQVRTWHLIAKRRRVRFRPDPLDYCQIDCRPGNLEPFAPDSVAILVDEEPMGGCGVVMLDTHRLEVGSHCRVKVGRLDPLRAKVVWRKPLEAGIVRLGFEFLE
jgi:hypothetical protein